MKFATLMMVAAVSAAAAAAPAAKCPALTAARKEAEKLVQSAITKSEATLKTSTDALTKCHTDHKATTDALKKTADAKGGDCYDEATTVAEETTALTKMKCLAKDVGGGGATIIIIIVVVVALCCAAGLAYYFCVHKKKGEAASTDAAPVEAGAMFSNNDDLYMAFIDNETAR